MSLDLDQQALDLIDPKANVTAQTNPVEDYQPQYEEISIQADEIIEEEKQRGFNLSSLPAQSFDRDSSNFTNYLGRVDQSVQGNRTQGVNRSMQITLQQVDQSAQNDPRLPQADRSVQKNFAGCAPYVDEQVRMIANNGRKGWTYIANGAAVSPGRRRLPRFSTTTCLLRPWLKLWRTVPVSTRGFSVRVLLGMLRVLSPGVLVSTIQQS